MQYNHTVYLFNISYMTQNQPQMSVNKNTLGKMLGWFNPILGQIWTNPIVGLKNAIYKFKVRH